MTTTPEIETPHSVLVVRHARHIDLFASYKQRNRARLEIWEPARDAAFATDHDAWADALERGSVGFTAGHSACFLALSHDRSRMLADCSLTNIIRGPLQGCNLGYSVDESAEGTGLMFEVASAVVGYAFQSLALHRVMAAYSPRSLRSARLLEKLGFEKEGLARSYLKIAGQWEDMVLTSRIHPAG